MLQVFGRNLQEFVGVFNCIFTFEFQSESSGNMFQFSGCFGTLGFGVQETFYLKNAQQCLVSHTRLWYKI